MGSKPATTALRAALRFARDKPGRCDERAIESLLWGALRESPDLAEALTGHRDLDFYLGMPDHADVVGFEAGTAEHAIAVIEVKVRAAFHWREPSQKSQLDAYAERSPDASLILVASDKSIENFHSRGTGTFHPDGLREFESYDRWAANIVPLDRLYELLDAALEGVPPDASAETIGCIVARQDV
ncbi:hypothetical protein [Nocardia heshunensis]